MRVLAVGASGAIGTRLVPQLIDRRHEVIGTFRSPGHAGQVQALGAESSRLDLLEPLAVRKFVKTEDDPLDTAPPGPARETNAAMGYLDKAVTEAGGIALCYGGFYGARNDGMVAPVRKRQFPVVGDAGGYSSASTSTTLPLQRCLRSNTARQASTTSSTTNPHRCEWLPVLADALDAKPPRHVPRWFARLVAGEAAVAMATQARGASNAKAKCEFGWVPRYPSWRQGFVAAYTSVGPS
jgi:nucleoside-diphosphate-sugar epimerase